MNTSDLLLELRDVLDDPNKDSWGDEELVRHGTRQLRSIWRHALDIVEGYGNCDLLIPVSAFNQTFNRVWDYRMPRWVSKVVQVRIREAGSTSTEQSPWLVSPAEDLGALLSPLAHNDIRGAGWEFHEPNVLRIQNMPLDGAIYVKVAKVPPQLGKFTLDLDGVDSTSFYLPDTFDQGGLDREAGVYRNAIFEVTDTAQTDEIVHGVVADLRRCIDSKPQQAIGTERRVLVTVDSAFSATLLAGDVIDIWIPLPDEHTRLLVLRVARAALQKHANRDIINSLRGELLEEEAKYMAYLQPRQRQEPSFIRVPTREQALRGQDKDYALYSYLEDF